MSLAQRAAAGARWAVVSIAGRRVVTVVTSLVLARFVTPTDFGLMAMAVVFSGFVELMRELGTGAAVVRAERTDDEMLSSLFWLNVGVGVLASAILWLLAPVAAAIFQNATLAPILRMLAVTPALAATGVVSAGLLTRELRFRRLAIAELGGACAGGVVGIALALKGLGVWSLVWQSVSSAFVISAATTGASGWRPRPRFRVASMRHLLGYSANLTGTSVLTYVIRNADSLLIGRYLGAQQLGLYDLAFRVMMSSLQVISAAIARVLFPVYVQLKDDRHRLAAAYLRAIGGIALVVFPVIFGLVGVADAFVVAAFGPAWAGAVPLLLILSPLAALQSIATSVNNIYQTVGRTDRLFAITALSGAALVAAFAVGLRWNVVGVAACYTAMSYALAYWVFAVPLRFIGLRPGALLGAIARPLLCSVLMLVAIVALRAAIPQTTSPAILLAVVVPSGVAAYAAATWRFNRVSASDVVRLAVQP